MFEYSRSLPVHRYCTFCFVALVITSVFVAFLSLLSLVSSALDTRLHDLSSLFQQHAAGPRIRGFSELEYWLQE
jgi:hypothetical protein